MRVPAHIAARLCILLAVGVSAAASAREGVGEAQDDSQEVSPSVEVAWPDAPAIRVLWDPRGPVEELATEFVVTDWELGEGRRHARLTRRIDDVGFIVYFEQFEGVEATRMTIAAINGFAFAGPRYFERYAIEVDGDVREDLAGKHVILPRGALLRRFCTGRQAAVLSEWRYVHENKPVPAWAVALAKKDTAKRRALPFRNMGGRVIDLGPYTFFWQNKSLSDSHGGWGIGPFHGGPDDWLTCSAGRANRATEMMLDFQRPIWMLADDFTPLHLEVAYWMGRTDEHEPREFQYVLDDWCSYAQTLAQYKFADYTHLSRGTAGAAAVAKWDAFAVECLGAVLNDFKTAQSLTRVVGKTEAGEDIPHPGALQDNPLLFPLWLKIETVHGPTSSGGDRGLAHWLRLLRWCRPYFPREELEPWEDGLRALVRGLADSYGITMAGNTPEWVGSPTGELSKPLVAPFVKTFQQQLVTYECMRFGGLDDIGQRGRHFLTPRPPAYFELRPGAESDTVLNRNHSADADQTNKKWSYEAYGNFTHNVVNGFESVSLFLSTMKSRGVNGSSQDLDCTPRELWEKWAH